jgi:hypothetical protein
MAGRRATTAPAWSPDIDQNIASSFENEIPLSGHAVNVNSQGKIRGWRRKLKSEHNYQEKNRDWSSQFYFPPRSFPLYFM